MKKLLIFGLFIFTFNVQAQTTYTVLKVEPKDAAEANGKVIKIGEKLKADTQIILNNSNAYLRVFDGRESATVRKSGLLSTGIVTVYSNPYYSYSAATNNLGLLYGSAILYTKDVIDKVDLITLLQTKPLLIIDSMHISIPSYMYALPVFQGEPESKFFFITYQYQGKEINKYLHNLANNTFVLDENIFSVVGSKIDKYQIQNVEMSYAINSETNEKIAQHLSLVFLNTTELKEEIMTFIDTSVEQDKEKLFNEILLYLKQYYGNPKSGHLKEWLIRNFEGRF